MTDTTASSVPPEQSNHGSWQQPGEPSPQPPDQTNSGWESVTFPGQTPLVAISEPGAEELLGASNDASPLEPAPENLVQLIQDLNQCNDALLLRVTELEEALERSQVALQAEIERTQASPAGLPIDRVPGPVQQQIAQLLSELDIANDGLRRTTIHNETLQTDLEVNRQRVAQLERECTLLQQRFSEKSTALQQAEETCRGLKARLHRQQRYTLQFKAALEKCLNMAPSAGAVNPAGVVQGQLLSPLSPALGEEAPQPVAMPRSQQIQPWSGGQAAVVNNPSLTQLLRGLRGTGPAAPAAPTPPAPPAPPEFLAEPPAAVAAQPAPPAPTPAPEPAADPWLEDNVAPSAPANLFTEPSPWGEPLATVQTEPTPVAPAEPAPAVAMTPATPVPATPVPATPVPTTPVQPATPATVRPAAAAAAPTLPSYLTTNAKASPSPLVYPLRSQKKITSIAAVELPSFSRTMRRR